MKKIYIIGGGTFSYVRNHLALAAPAFGETATDLYLLCCHSAFNSINFLKKLSLTKMADNLSSMVTNEDVEEYVKKIIEDLDTKIIFFNVAMCDFSGTIDGVKSGKYAERLKTSEGDKTIQLTPTNKVLSQIRKKRKDIFLVAFKTTCGATENEQYKAGLNLLKKNSCNLVLANDTKTRLNMIITPEEAKYHVTTDRDICLRQLVDMTFYRSQLSFTHSTVVDGKPVDWSDEAVFPSLRKVVDYCINNGAYKPFNGATVGHFACKIGDKEFLTSIRKSNFNDLQKNGLVRIKTDGDDTVIAYGAKPSVGGQSQRIIFSNHKDKEYDCIVHFHCPIKEGSEVPVISQREYECGSHECGENTSRNLKQFGNMSAVMLDNHGPNIVFNHNTNPDEIINFINENFDLKDKTSGLL